MLLLLEDQHACSHIQCSTVSFQHHSTLLMHPPTGILTNQLRFPEIYFLIQRSQIASFEYKSMSFHCNRTTFQVTLGLKYCYKINQVIRVLVFASQVGSPPIGQIFEVLNLQENKDIEAQCESCRSQTSFVQGIFLHCGV